MDCAGRGSRSRCLGPPSRRCSRCGAVSYCSVSHQISHWTVHKKECDRLKQQMNRAKDLNDFPFTFSLFEKGETRCSLLIQLGVHRFGMWMFECKCGQSASISSRLMENWNLSSYLSPCRGPWSPLTEKITCWADYYKWRQIPLSSPAALLMHWPLTVYWAIQLAISADLIPGVHEDLHIHYLGPDKELHQLAVFAELQALFPGVKILIDLIGPAIPLDRDGERIVIDKYALCSEIDCECKCSSGRPSPCGLTDNSLKIELQLHAGYYHDLGCDLLKASTPHVVVAPNAGIAAYMSWLPTIELIKDSKVPAIFSDYCEEAAHMATCCISTISSGPPSIPIQLNPFRQPLAVEDSALLLPCYSNCFLFGM